MEDTKTEHGSGVSSAVPTYLLEKKSVWVQYYILLEDQCHRGVPVLWGDRCSVCKGVWFVSSGFHMIVRVSRQNLTLVADSCQLAEGLMLRLISVMAEEKGRSIVLPSKHVREICGNWNIKNPADCVKTARRWQKLEGTEKFSLLKWVQTRYSLCCGDNNN